jgi:hypothetical protein
LAEKGREGREKVTERKMGNEHLLEAGKAIYVKAGRVRKVTERKMGNMHLLEACKVMCGKSEKVTERKMDNMHLLEAWENTVKYGGKRARKGAKRRGESDGKKDGQ